MKQKAKNRGQVMNVLFTMLLFLVFVLCALFTVLIGGKVYENISTRMEENYAGSVVLNYVANKVRQGDTAGMVDVVEIDGTQVLELKQNINDQEYVTQIYYIDGSLRELFTNVDSGLTLTDGLKIMDCNPLNLSKENGMLRVETTGQGGGTLLLTPRSGGQQDE